VHYSNEAELCDYLLKAYHEYKDLGAVQYRGIEAEVMKYSHREIARMYEEVLERVIGGSETSKNTYPINIYTLKNPIPNYPNIPITDIIPCHSPLRLGPLHSQRMFSNW